MSPLPVLFVRAPSTVLWTSCLVPCFCVFSPVLVLCALTLYPVSSRCALYPVPMLWPLVPHWLSPLLFPLPCPCDLTLVTVLSSASLPPHCPMPYLLLYLLCLLFPTRNSKCGTQSHCDTGQSYFCIFRDICVKSPSVILWCRNLISGVLFNFINNE